MKKKPFWKRLREIGQHSRGRGIRPREEHELRRKIMSGILSRLNGAPPKFPPTNS